MKSFHARSQRSWTTVLITMTLVAEGVDRRQTKSAQEIQCNTSIDLIRIRATILSPQRNLKTC